MKDLYVCFQKSNGARIFKTEELARAFGGTILKNPDLSKVYRISPSYWSFENGEVVPSKTKISPEDQRHSMAYSTVKRTAHLEKLVKISLAVSVVLTGLVIYILFKGI